MKRFLVLIVFLNFIPTTFAQWEWINPKPQGNYLSDIFLFNEDTIIAVGDAGTIMKTSDRGISWNVKHQIRPYTLFTRITFTNQNDGFMLSEYSGLYKTSDAGETWNYIYGFHSYGASCIKFINETTGFVGGGAIYKTTNSGLTWIMKAAASVRSIDFVNDTLGWAARTNGSIYKTTNSGEIWFSLNSVTDQFLTEVDFINDQVGVAVGYNGTIITTTNGGTSWIYRDIGTNRYLNSVYCRDENNYLAVGDSGIILKTTNGGISWSISNDETTARLSKIRASGDRIFAIGYHGIILYSTDFGENWLKIGTELTRETLNSVSNINSENIFVAGNNGTILLTSDGGDSWSKSNTGTNNNLNAIDFISQSIGWAVGDNGCVLYTNNYGDSWETNSFPSADNLLSVDFYDEDLGLIVGDNGAIFKTTNGGLSWLNRTTGNYDFTDVCLTDSLTIWVVNAQRQILRSQNGGNSFSIITTINSRCNSIIFLNTQIGFVAADGGIYKTTDAGLTWNPKSGFKAKNLSFINESFGWGCGENGMIFRTINGGNTWDTFGSHNFSEKTTDNLLNAIFFKNMTQGFAFGEGGTIIKTENASPTPVELTSFTATLNQLKVQLTWQTATELNNQGFEIQRKIEDTDWITIGFRTGQGTTTEPTSYFYEDNISEISTPNLLYRLKQIDFNGSYQYSDEIEVLLQSLDYTLYQNYPNPFNPVTIIKYEVPQISNVKIEVFDVLGRVVKVLVDEEKSVGRYEDQFNGSSVASGLYYYRITAGDFIQTKKMMLIK
jgi:photosystem II stability/assembly factor-like uncharacterized protein